MDKPELDEAQWRVLVYREQQAYLQIYPGNPRLALRLAISWVAQRFRRQPIGG